MYLDGHIYQSQDIGDKFTGQPWNEGDVIGCGVNYSTREVFFTTNGQLIIPPANTKPLVFENELLPYLYPTLGTLCLFRIQKRSYGLFYSFLREAIFRVETVAFNFGRKPFVFDLLQYQREHTSKSSFKPSAAAAAAGPPAFNYIPLSRRGTNSFGLWPSFNF